MRRPLTDAQKRDAADLGKHAALRAAQALTDALALCSDPRQRANVALRMVAAVYGMVSAEIDKAEGRKPDEHSISPEAHGILMATFASLGPADPDPANPAPAASAAPVRG